MLKDEKINISILGLGLIGGSIAKALKKSSDRFIIRSFDLPETLCQALEEKVIDDGLASIEDAVNSDFIFLCLPVDLSLEAFKKLMPIIRENTVITDVCGVKGIFQTTWNSSPSKGIYIGGHPMTGKEKGGYLNSDPLLFENAVYIVSETTESTDLTERFLSVIRLLGARIVSLNPFLHDSVVANVSHLPQLLAVALVNNASQNSDNEKSNLDFAAGGFRDMTRIASSAFNIWQPVLKYNKNEILEALESFQREIQFIKDTLLSDRPEVLDPYFDSARISRDGISKDTKGFLSPLFYISLYVKDEPGIISRISTALFSEAINIKDIELLKIREGTGGTFRLAFDDEIDAERAKVILKNIGFDVF